MVFWQLTIDANDPALLARFWAQALGYQPVPPAEPQTTWQAHYHARLGEEAAFPDRLFDPAGLRPPIWFQEVPETKMGKNRLHLDLYPAREILAVPRLVVLPFHVGSPGFRYRRWSASQMLSKPSASACCATARIA
jgi:Glyoxalase-like domain